jgi:hypothetical protein
LLARLDEPVLSGRSVAKARMPAEAGAVSCVASAAREWRQELRQATTRTSSLTPATPGVRAAALEPVAHLGYAGDAQGDPFGGVAL